MDASEAETGERVGRYRLTRLLARTDLSEVHLGRDEDGRAVCVKRPIPEAAAPGSAPALAFRHEARLLAEARVRAHGSPISGVVLRYRSGGSGAFRSIEMTRPRADDELFQGHLLGNLELDAEAEASIVAFLETLSDGYLDEPITCDD